MAEILNNTRARIGRQVLVKNTEAYATASDEYVAIWTDTSLKSKECLLFTKSEIERAKIRANHNKEDIPKRGLISKILDILR